MRFSGFDDEWKSFKLSEISKRITRKNKSLETDRPLTISAQYGLVDQIEYFNKIVASKSLKGYYLLNKGEFAYNKSYSNGYPFGAVKRLDDYENGAISTLYICFNTNDKMNSDLLKEYFETDKWHEEIYKIAVEGARNHGLLNVAVGDFFNTKHVLPTNNHEQEKIAKFLIEINTKIDLLENKHKAYQDFKKYLMQKIFAQELRFNFTDEWEKYLLGDISLIGKGFTPSTSNPSFWDGDLKWLSIADMNQGKYINQTTKKITSDGSKNKEPVKKSTLLMSFKLSIGKLGILTEDMYTNEAICNFKWKNKDVLTEYMYYYLSSINILKYGSQAAKGITLNNETLSTIPVLLPSLEEQKKIINILSDVDMKINMLENSINDTSKFKKGLLQQMFVVQLILSLLQNKKHI